MNHAMIDLETLGTRTGSIILSIGAVVFDPMAGKVHTKKPHAGYFQNVSINDSLASNYTLDKDTLLFWMDQSEEAKANVFKKPCSELEYIMASFEAWLKAGKIERLWGHPSAFDLSMLAVMWDKDKRKVPWKVQHTRCSCTLLQTLGLKVELSEGHVEHHALHDAIDQAKAVCKAFDLLKQKGIR